MDRGVAWQPNLVKHRLGRKLLNLVLPPREVAAYRSALYEHAVCFLVNLLSEPDEFVRHIRTSVPSYSMVHRPMLTNHRQDYRRNHHGPVLWL